MVSFRKLHRTIALFSFVPLGLTILTGMAYRILRYSGAEKTSVAWLMGVHRMSVLHLGAVWPLLVGGAALFLLFSGVPLIATASPALKWDRRALHSLFGVLLLLPLALTYVTGILFAFCDSFLGFRSKILMRLHEGKLFVEPALYVSIVGAGAMILLLSGVRILQPLSYLRTARRQSPRGVSVPAEVVPLVLPSHTD